MPRKIVLPKPICRPRKEILKEMHRLSRKEILTKREMEKLKNLSTEYLVCYKELPPPPKMGYWKRVRKKGRGFPPPPEELFK